MILREQFLLSGGKRSKDRFLALTQSFFFSVASLYIGSSFYNVTPFGGKILYLFLNFEKFQI